MRVLTWNIFHGRAQPPAGRELLAEFARALSGWEWDAALLQEVPPWWPQRLAAATGARERHVLTSRNALLPLRRAIARRAPDAIKSNGGGCNAILLRGAGGVVEHRVLRLRRWPERRLLHAVRTGEGVWLANLHATAHSPPRARGDHALALATARRWADGAPLVLGGDLNLSRLDLPGLHAAAAHGVDHVYAAGMQVVAPGEVLEHAPLSDHAPVVANLQPDPTLATRA